MSKKTPTILIPLEDRHFAMARALREPLQHWLLTEHAPHEWRSGCLALLNSGLALAGIYALGWDPMLMLWLIIVALAVDSAFAVAAFRRHPDAGHALFDDAHFALVFALAIAEGKTERGPAGRPALWSHRMPIADQPPGYRMGVTYASGDPWLAHVLTFLLLLPALWVLVQNFEPSQWPAWLTVLAAAVAQVIVRSHDPYVAPAHLPWRWSRTMGLSDFGLVMLAMCACAAAVSVITGSGGFNLQDDTRDFVAILAGARMLWALNQLLTAWYSRRLVAKLDRLKT